MTGARWAASLAFSKENWRVEGGYGLTRARKLQLNSFINDPAVKHWLAGALGSGRVRSRNLSRSGGAEGRAFLFPNQVNKGALLVGSADLDRQSKDFFRVLALSPQDADAGLANASTDPLLPYEQANDSRIKTRPVDRLATLLPVLSTANTTSRLAQRAARSLTESLPIQKADVYLQDPASHSIILTGSHSRAENGTEVGARIELRKSDFDALLSWGDTTQSHFNPVSKLPFLRNALPQPGRSGYNSATPLVSENGVLGLVVCEHSETLYFSPETRAAFNNFLAIMAARFETISLRREAIRLRTQLEAVQETSQDIAELDLDEVMTQVVMRARDLVKAPGVELGLVQEKEGIIRILIADTPWAENTDTIIPIGIGAAGQIALDGSAIFVNDYNNWEHRLWPDRTAPFQAVAGVPLKVRGHIIGTLTVIDNDPTRAFSSADLRTLELLASQISVSLRNTGLIQELNDRVKSQQQTERRLIQSARLAAVGEMAAGVAHELNNPLTTITGFAELMLEDLPEDSDQHDDLGLILREARRARGVVRRLLDFSRQTESIKLPADVNEILGEVLALVHHVAKTSNVDIQLEPWDELPHIEVDRGQIKQVALNLVQNAIQAMPDGGILSIRTSPLTREDRPYLAFAIQDRGLGISEENIHQIFEPFFTTKAVGSGTGLGLSISYGIVADHGGYIDVESELGIGSTFTVWLPMVQVEDSSADE